MSITEKLFEQPAIPETYSTTGLHKKTENFVAGTYYGAGKNDPVYDYKFYAAENRPFQIAILEKDDGTSCETRTYYMTSASEIFFMEYKKFVWNDEMNVTSNELGSSQVTSHQKQIVSRNESGDVVTLAISPDDPLTDLSDQHRTSLTNIFRYNYAHLKSDHTDEPTLAELRIMLNKIDVCNHTASRMSQATPAPHGAS